MTTVDIAMQKYIAAILSDGSLSPTKSSVQFILGLADNRRDLVQRELIPVDDLLKFLQSFAAEVTIPLGVLPCDGHPRINPHCGKNNDDEWLTGVLLETLTSELNIELYQQYYPNGIKAIPDDFILTDIFLAWFFMFDGCSKWHSSGAPTINVSLHTEGFDLHSVELFEKQLHRFDIDTGRGYYKAIEHGAGISITIPSDSTNHFMDVINPHMIFPYRYKIKYRGSCPSELFLHYRQHSNERQREYRKNKKQFASYEKLNSLCDKFNIKTGVTI
jgi:hypothetical protein